MDAAFVRERITQLRMQKNISEYQMSYDLGHSRSYINNISSGKTLPSMTEFLAICEYFGIEPEDFFNDELKNPRKVFSLLERMSALNEKDLTIVENIVDRLAGK